MSRKLSKKTVHIDLPKFFKTPSKHPYNLRPRRKRVIYSEKLQSRIRSNHEILQIDLSDSFSSKESSLSNSQEEVQKPAELLTHFVKENFSNASITEFPKANYKIPEPKISKMETENEKNDSDGNHKSMEEPIGTLQEPQVRTTNNDNDDESAEFFNEIDAEEQFSNNTYQSENAHFSGFDEAEVGSGEHEPDFDDVEEEDDDVERYQFNYSWAFSSNLQDEAFDPLENIADFDANAMGDGRHNPPNILEFHVTVYDEENAEPEDDFDY